MALPQYDIIETNDGSHSLKLKESGVSFHSVHGALQESQHVFIEAGLKYYIDNNSRKKSVKVFEMGFGTGLNALLSAKTAQQTRKDIEYHSIDLFPLPENIFFKLNYAALIREPELYRSITQTAWNQLLFISPFFKLKKIREDLGSYLFTDHFDVIFYDAFAPGDSPELWTDIIFKKVYNALREHGILITYCSKSVVRKSLESAGFLVEKLPGPPGKREILRAVKRSV